MRFTKRAFSTVTKYTKDHEWVRYSTDSNASNLEITIGITNHAQSQLGDVVFVDPVEIGINISKGDVVAAVESVKAASDIYSPVDGVITDKNDTLENDPGVVNSSPENDGWFVKMNIDDPAVLDSLLNEDDYKSIVDGSS